MTPFQKKVKAAIAAEAPIYPSKIVCLADGTVVMKDSYFYRMGKTAGGWGAQVVEALGKAGVPCEVREVRDDYAYWPKVSYFVAIVGEPTEGVRAKDGASSGAQVFAQQVGPAQMRDHAESQGEHGK